MNNKLLQAIQAEIPKHPGPPILLSDLRVKLFGLSKAVFDAEILALAKSGKYFLTRHFHPASSTEQEKEMMIPDGAGNYYFAINPRGDAELSQNAPKTGRGGSREGACRPMKKTKIKRAPLQGARIPGWLMDWLKVEGNTGRKIEVALIGYYGLTPPG